MTPSDRINLIREISRRLSKDDWSIIDLTLAQFDIPIQNSWSGDSSSYIIEMAKNAGDQILLDLAKHLGYEHGVNKSSIEPDFWLSGYFRLFISHLSANKVFAGQLQDELLNYNISSFVAHKDIRPTRQWENEIIVGLSTCDALMALLEEGFHESDWTDQEIGFAMGRNTLVIAVQLGEQAYGFMSRFQAVNGIGKGADEIANEVMTFLTTHKQTMRRFAQSLVSRLENSGSFSESKHTMDLIQKSPYMDSTLLTRVQAAFENNGQVRGTFHMGSRISTLVDKWTKT